MAPRGHTLPQAMTESAREARKPFNCELCGKHYARMNEFEAHELSYDHQHRKRLKEMKQFTRDPNAASKAERERKANEEAGLKSINLSLSSSGSTTAPGAGGGAGKKKPVFKSTLQPQNAATTTPAAPTLQAPPAVALAPTTAPPDPLTGAANPSTTGPGENWIDAFWAPLTAPDPPDAHPQALHQRRSPRDPRLPPDPEILYRDWTPDLRERYDRVDPVRALTPAERAERERPIDPREPGIEVMVGMARRRLGLSA